MAATTLATSPSPSASSDAAAPEPLLHPRLPERVRVRLGKAIPVALERLRDHRTCRALFERLEADGAAKLRSTSYYRPSAEQERRYCRRHGHAFTEVGGSAVVVCPSFSNLSDSEAAIILIHEALHFAGQTEYPSDPAAPNALAITERVMKGCQLF